MNLERDGIRSRVAAPNGLAPIIVALFANSRQYAGQRTEWASYRAQLWMTLDASRTGIVYDQASPHLRYFAFALDATAMRSGGAAGYRTFRDWMADSTVSRDDWLFHLSTLFPEVRAKEFFEMRSADTIEPDALAAGGVVTGGLRPERADRGDLIARPVKNLLERAGRWIG